MGKSNKNEKSKNISTYKFITVGHNSFSINGKRIDTLDHRSL
jgi:hypothetical protein